MNPKKELLWGLWGNPKPMTNPELEIVSYTLIGSPRRSPGAPLFKHP